MTELEFEKTCRGKDIDPVANEFAFPGNIHDPGAGEILPDEDEDGDETISDSNANCNYGDIMWSSGDCNAGTGFCSLSPYGPLRVGIFAESSTTRTAAGAGYYGNMELSGNVQEPAVTVGRSEGRAFLGTHGDGALTTTSSDEGNATNIDWPGIDDTNDQGITGTVGIGWRGGGFKSVEGRLYVSDRTNAAKDSDSEGYDQRFDAPPNVIHGGRFVRTAP